MTRNISKNDGTSNVFDLIKLSKCLFLHVSIFKSMFVLEKNTNRRKNVFNHFKFSESNFRSDTLTILK